MENKVFTTKHLVHAKKLAYKIEQLQNCEKDLNEGLMQNTLSVSISKHYNSGRINLNDYDFASKHLEQAIKAIIFDLAVLRSELEEEFSNVHKLDFTEPKG